MNTSKVHRIEEEIKDRQEIIDNELREIEILNEALEAAMIAKYATRKVPLKYTVYGADRAGDTWECRQTDSPIEVISLLAGLRRLNPNNVFGVYLTDDPERGDQEMDIEEIEEATHMKTKASKPYIVLHLKHQAVLGVAERGQTFSEPTENPKSWAAGFLRAYRFAGGDGELIA